MRLAAGLLVLLAVPVAAEDVSYSDAPTLACLEGGGGGSCAGVAARACMEASDAGRTTFGSVDCLDRELEFWDRRLARFRASAFEEAQAADEASLTDGLGPSELAPMLGTLDTAWEVYRDARCTFEQAQYRSGTGGSPAYLRCLMQVTADQAHYLETRRIGG